MARVNTDGPGPDKERLTRIKYHILLAENQNLKTHAKSFDEMVDAVLRIIQDEVNKHAAPLDHSE